MPFSWRHAGVGRYDRRTQRGHPGREQVCSRADSYQRMILAGLRRWRSAVSASTESPASSTGDNESLQFIMSHHQPKFLMGSVRRSTVSTSQRMSQDRIPSGR